MTAYYRIVWRDELTGQCGAGDWGWTLNDDELLKMLRERQHLTAGYKLWIQIGDSSV